MKQTESDDQVGQLAELIREVRIAMLTTNPGDGPGLRSRPMYTQETPFDGVLWFMTSSVSDVVGEIERNSEVLLSYAHPGDHSYVSVNGVAEVLNDRAMIRELWRPALKVWFPDGAEDPDIRLIRVTVERAEFWDAPAAPVRLFQFAKALATGEQMQGATHETVNMSPPQGGRS